MAATAPNLYDVLGMGDQSSQGFYAEGDTYICPFVEQGVQFAVSRVELSKAEVHAMVRVTSSIPSTRSRLYYARTNLSGPSSRRSFASDLEAATNVIPKELWRLMIEDVCCWVIDQIEQGSPVVRIGSVAPREGGMYRANPLALERLPVVLYGREGNGKGLVALTCAMAVHTGIGLADFEVIQGPVLYCDWELDDWATQEQVKLLASGFSIPTPDIHYQRCTYGLAQEAEAIGRYIDREGIVMVIVDSLGYAAGGADKQQQDVTTRMFGAMRQWNVSVVCIDHMAKGEDADTPFGSVYTLASARNAWRVRGTREGNDVHVGLFQSKANIGVHDPVGLKYTFWPTIYHPESIFCEREDVRDIPEMRKSLSASEQIIEALKDARQSMTVTDLVNVTEMKETVVRARLNDLMKSSKVTRFVAIGTQSAARYALLSNRDEQGVEQVFLV